MKQGAYRNYLLAVLLVILAFNYVDRLALGIVLQDIKVELALTDTQLGFLSGIAFALFYAVMGLPIARWADRGDRVTIISVTAVLWSAAVALCGAAASFIQLLLIRVGVAVGEAGCIPPAHSLISDHFTRAERPRALAIYMLGLPLGMVIGYFVAGWLNQFHGWRTTFVMLGIPGLALAALAALTLNEPRRKRAAHEAHPGAENPPQPALRDVCATLWGNATFRHLLLCLSVVYFFGYGILQWQPAFFMRTYGLQSGEIGTWFAVIYGLGGVLGTYCGGALASRRAAYNERLQLKTMAMMYLAFGVLSIFTYVSPTPYVAFGLMGVATIGGNAGNGPLFAMVQSLVPERMRAVAIAAIYFFANLIGMGLGPLAAGALSDAFHTWAGDASLRYALLALCPGYAWAAWHLWRASKTVTRELSAACVPGSTRRAAC